MNCRLIYYLKEATFVIIENMYGASYFRLAPSTKNDKKPLIIFLLSIQGLPDLFFGIGSDSKSFISFKNSADILMRPMFCFLITNQ
jgi:hypothetical protein